MSETNENVTKTETKPKAKKRAALKAPTKPKPAAPKSNTKAETPKKERPPRESRNGWGTFALKLPVPEREAFHAASGAAGASRFARIVLNAFSNEDEAAFKNAIAEARKLR